MPVWFGTLARSAAVSIGLGFLFAWLEVYGTASIPFPWRIAYWTGLMAVGITASVFVTPVIFDRWLARRHASIRILVAAAIISIPVTAGLLAIEVATGLRITLIHVVMQYGYVLVVSTVLTTGAWAIDRLRNPLTPETAAPAGRAPFIDRLPVRLRSAEVWAVSSEDHYLRVHTSAGEELILMRLADALRELNGIEGLQTHRSWWVARAGLADVAKGDGRVTLKLKSGVEAPVSRTYLKAVRDAGWA